MNTRLIYLLLIKYSNSFIYLINTEGFRTRSPINLVTHLLPNNFPDAIHFCLIYSFLFFCLAIFLSLTFLSDSGKHCSLRLVWVRWVVCFMAHSTNSIWRAARYIEGKDEQLLGRGGGGDKAYWIFFFSSIVWFVCSVRRKWRTEVEDCTLRLTIRRMNVLVCAVLSWFHWKRKINFVSLHET
jgi:hypothetical protein